MIAGIGWKDLSARNRSGLLLGLGLTVGLAAGLALCPTPNPPGADATRSAAGQPGPASALPTPRGSVAGRDPAGTDLPGAQAIADRTSRSRAGALAAGARYACLLAQIWPMDRAGARETVADVASGAYRDRLVAAVSAQVLPMQVQAASLGARTKYRQSVLATHLDNYAPSARGGAERGAVARVSVWAVLTITPSGSAGGAGTANVSGAFFTSHVDLLWERGAWRLSGSTDHPGPTPLVEGIPSTGAQMADQLDGFDDWRPR